MSCIFCAWCVQRAGTHWLIQTRAGAHYARSCRHTLTNTSTGLRWNASLGLLTVMEYQHGSRDKGGDLRVWVCDVAEGLRKGKGLLAHGSEWQRLAPPKPLRRAGGVAHESAGAEAGGEAITVRDACWYEDTVLLLHRAGGVSVHVPGESAGRLIMSSPGRTDAAVTIAPLRPAGSSRDVPAVETVEIRGAAWAGALAVACQSSRLQVLALSLIHI